MTRRDREPRRFRPCLEGLEARDLPSALHVVGRDPTVPGAKGPFLNLIVVKDSSPYGHAGAPRVHRTRGLVTPARHRSDVAHHPRLDRALHAPVTATTSLRGGRHFVRPGTHGVP
jgi:hypothetical protein